MREITIHASQVGYRPNATKRAIVIGECEHFELVDVINGGAVYRGDIEYGGYSEKADEYVRYADFTDFSTPGRYCLAVDGNYSYSFAIGEDVLIPAQNAVLKALFYNRCGCPDMHKGAGLYAHPACHTAPVPEKDNESKLMDLSGGWHDAGDYGRYTTAGGETVTRLLATYELFPNGFSAEIHIPESGNGTPDILNEARWELKWLLKMQKDDGSFYHKVTGPFHAGFGTKPEDDKNHLMAFVASPEATSSAGGCLATAARLYRKFDPDFADICMKSALRAWDWMLANEQIPPYDKNDGSQTGIYNYGFVWQDILTHRIWFAGELFATTRDASYLKYVEKYMKDRLEYNPGYDTYLLYTFLTMKASGAEVQYPENFKKAISAILHDAADGLMKEFSVTKYEIPQATFGTYSTAQLLQNVMQLIGADLLEPNEKYHLAIAEAVNYLFGKNACGYSFITGIGSHFCNNVHMSANENDGIDTSEPGWMTAGPGRIWDIYQTHKNPGVNILLEMDSHTPEMKGYVDKKPFYRINEPTIYTNANLVMALGYLNQ